MKEEKVENSILSNPLITNDNKFDIQENYIDSIVENKRESGTSFINDESPKVFTSGLYNQLLGKERQKSQFYNVLLLTCFNMNLAQYTFPHLTIKVGIITMIIFVILSMMLSYYVQKSLLNFLTDYKSECNFGKVVELNLGNFTAYLVEIFTLIWYFTLLMICTNSLESAITYVIEFEYYINNENLCKIIISVCLFLVYCFVNTIKNQYLIDLYVFVCLIAQFVSFIVS
jgi:hypothetical protein